MVTYICSKCNKKFSAKIDYTRHMNRKKPCNKNEETQIDGSNGLMLNNANVMPNNAIVIPNKTKQDKLKCHYCMNIFSSTSVLYRHIRLNCKVKKQETIPFQNLHANSEKGLLS